ncbi:MULTISPECIES: 30S ribosomal protein S17e [Fervidicoccus]|uniref:Small ribosomal subunit protein eS17 n=2 Tax=Fervidicoccus fontis TaxID=683846 RepID=I0A1E5_FERFK|nr:30S ribosomal protein S17e [Fervidicoccus fontis]AFH42802.1 30S ribosomal protein S17e [Fervidicoccus fontis Kam940]PMB76864.1 MAG: 30S ribosomal protein S17e [Fervidicoccus fontis]HEW64151.1 30S ribosomal protein S17e [Fervidicoccus fontis]
MGKVRTAMVKRTARKLITAHPDLFTEDFEENKQLIRKLVDVNSKRVSNKIAGYITHLVKVTKQRGELQ